LPYQDRQTLDDELPVDALEEEEVPPRRPTKLVLLVIVVILAAAGVATAFALLHPPS